MTPVQLPPEQLHAMATAFGDETAYTVVGGSSLTFDQWDTNATRLARGLIDAGSRPGTGWPSTSSRPTPCSGW